MKHLVRMLASISLTDESISLLASHRSHYGQMLLPAGEGREPELYGIHRPSRAASCAASLTESLSSVVNFNVRLKFLHSFAVRDTKVHRVSMSQL
jgi:hypothetical protein